jgi:hypothetical protein
MNTTLKYGKKYYQIKTDRLNLYEEATALKMTNKLVKDNASLDSQSNENKNCCNCDTRDENISDLGV